MMEVIKKAQFDGGGASVKKNAKEARAVDINLILTEFNYAVATKKFHYLSSDAIKLVMYSAYANYFKEEYYEEIESRLKDAGWNAKCRIKSCGHGWFYAIEITL